MNNRLLYSLALTAGIICLLVYLKSLSCGFVNWDDTEFVLNNEILRALDSDLLVYAFTDLSIFHWVPLLWISFAIDYHFWGLDPFGYHLTNILLHAANTGLAVLIADGLFRKHFEKYDAEPLPGYLYPAMLLLAGLLFGLHPAKVESVAWITERKDVLNGIFSLGSICCYLRYVQKQEATGRNAFFYKEYISFLLLFLLSLMAKPSSVLIPVTLLVMDWYPLGRMQKGKLFQILAEKVPCFAVSAAIFAISMFFKVQTGDFNPLSEFPFSIRVIVSGNAIAEYFKVMLYPVGILPYYDLPSAIPKLFIVKTIGVVCLILFTLFLGRKRPWIPAVILSFVITIFPSLQFFAAGAQLIFASRYTYLPSLFPIIIVSALIAMQIPKLAGSWQLFGKFIVAGLILSVLGFYTVTTLNLIDVWKDSGAMWSRVIASRPFDRAYFYRGLYYVDSGKYEAAVEDYTKCIEILAEKKRRDIYNLHAFRGEALIKAGRNEEAVKDFDLAISMFPHKLYYFHRGTALQNLGRNKDAEADFLKAGRAKGQMYWFPIGSPL